MEAEVSKIVREKGHVTVTKSYKRRNRVFHCQSQGIQEMQGKKIPLSDSSRKALKAEDRNNVSNDTKEYAI